MIKSVFHHEDVQRVIDIKTIHLSAIDILITAKIELKETHKMKSSDLVNEIEASIRENLSGKKGLYL
ncbi:hypothetical protein [Streptococcus uberis]